MKKILLLIMLPVSFCVASCNRPNQSSKPSFGDALESSFSQSPNEEKARSVAQQRQQQLKANQQKLQQDRLKSYSDTSSFGQNP